MKERKLILSTVIIAGLLFTLFFYFYSQRELKKVKMEDIGKPKSILAKREGSTGKGDLKYKDKDNSWKSEPSPSPAPLHSKEYDKLPKKQKLLLDGARSRLGDIYDASYYSEGEPPEGKSACVDVVYYAYKKIDVDLQKKVNADLRANPSLYPAKGDYAINHRRCPNLIVWFKRFTKNLTKKTDKKNLSQWKPGDVVFWSLTDDGVADHVGIISEKKKNNGIPLVIHQFPPVCKEEDVLKDWVIMGHFRY